MDSEYPWEVTFETPLRCGGNPMVPGMDKNARKYEELASAMGLWASRHCSESLGAEQLSKVYPDEMPSYENYPLTFYKLRGEAVRHQVDKQVIQNVGYRGQDDVPIQVENPSFDTPEKRRKILSSIMKQQSNLVKQYVDSPVFSVSFNDEATELYCQGLLTLPESVVLTWADNGHRKIVSRHQSTDNPETPPLPGMTVDALDHGASHWVSYCSLQAANHITMLPDSTELVRKKPREAYDNGIRDIWSVDSSSIKPHVFTLGFIASQWSGSGKSIEEHLRHYLEEYFPAYVTPDRNATLRNEVEVCSRRYRETALVCGESEDEHAGERFYNYVTRELACCQVKDNKIPCGNLSWCTREEILDGQIQRCRTLYKGGIPDYASLLEQCEELATEAGRLWEDSLLLQVRIHYSCMEGTVEFYRAFEGYRGEEYHNYSHLLNQSAGYYHAAVEAMDCCSHGKQKGFYENECLTGVKETVCLLRRVMFYVRILGDDPYFYLWQHQTSYVPEGNHAILITNKENYATNNELYEATRARREGTELQ